METNHYQGDSRTSPTGCQARTCVVKGAGKEFWSFSQSNDDLVLYSTGS